MIVSSGRGRRALSRPVRCGGAARLASVFLSVRIRRSDSESCCRALFFLFSCVGH